MMHHGFRSIEARRARKQKYRLHQTTSHSSLLDARQGDVTRKLNQALILVDWLNFNFVDEERSDIMVMVIKFNIVTSSSFSVKWKCEDINKALLESKTPFLSAYNHFVVGFHRVYRYYIHDIYITMSFFTKIRTKSSSRNYTTNINVGQRWRTYMRKSMDVNEASADVGHRSRVVRFSSFSYRT